MMSLFGPGNKITSRNPGFRNAYIFNNNKEPKVFYDILNDLLHMCYYDNILLSYQIRFRHIPISDIRLISTSYSDTKLVFVENTDMYTTNGISLLGFLQFFNNLHKPTKETLLNNELKTDRDNILFSYQINNNTITFI